MTTRRTSRMGRSLATLLGAALIVAGAGMAVARTRTGPPFAQPSPTASPTVDPQQQRQNVDTFFASQSDCGVAFVGQANLSDQVTLDAFSALVDGLNAGQRDHMVQSVRVLLQNCATHPNDGLKNALYHHGLNWVKHFQHEQWLEQKFASKWADGKPGKTDKQHGNPHLFASGTTNGGGHGNPHVTPGS